MCGKADGSSNIQVTGSSNQGHGSCCKADNVTDAHCKGTDDYICSPPILKADNTPAFKDIMTAGKNMQMIAYCPLMKPATCGLTSADHGVTVKPGAAKSIALKDATQLLATPGTSRTGKYGACYYEFSA